MKFTLIAAAIASVNAFKLESVPAESLMSGAHWRKSWPEGAVDDATNDEHVIGRHHHSRQKAAKPQIKYFENFRQWTPGTWPVYHTWNGAMTKATYHN